MFLEKPAGPEVWGKCRVSQAEKDLLQQLQAEALEVANSPRVKALVEDVARFLKEIALLHPRVLSYLFRAFFRAWEEATQPGTFFGDWLLIRKPEASDGERIEALRRMGSQHFSRGRVFFHGHWWARGGELEDAFQAWRGQSSYTEAWCSLAMPHLLDAIRNPQSTGEQSLGELYQEIRRRVRVGVQRDLLGRTTDAGDPFEKLSEEVPVPHDVPDVELRIDILQALAHLTDKERCAVLSEGGDASMRVARHRGRKKMREFLGMM